MGKPTKENLTEVICHFLSFHKENKTPFFEFLLFATDSKIIGNRFVWNMSKRYHCYLSIDVTSQEIKTLDFVDENHSSAMVATETILKIFYSELNGWIYTFNNRHKDQKVHLPLYQFFKHILCANVRFMLSLPGFTKYLEEMEKGTITGSNMYFWSDSLFVWFYFDIKNEVVAITSDQNKLPSKHQEELETKVIQKISVEIRDFLLEYFKEYILYIIAREIINNQNNLNLLVEECFVDGSVLYWRVGERQLFRIDPVACTVHAVEYPTDMVVFSPQLDKTDEKRLAIVIDQSLKSRGLEKISSEINRGKSNLFLGPFSLN